MCKITLVYDDAAAAATATATAIAPPTAAACVPGV
jgi:hypothetical protein